MIPQYLYTHNQSEMHGLTVADNDTLGWGLAGGTWPTVRAQSVSVLSAWCRSYLWTVSCFFLSVSDPG